MSLLLMRERAHTTPHLWVREGGDGGDKDRRGETTSRNNWTDDDGGDEWRTEIEERTKEERKRRDEGEAAETRRRRRVQTPGTPPAPQRRRPTGGEAFLALVSGHAAKRITTVEPCEAPTGAARPPPFHADRCNLFHRRVSGIRGTACQDHEVKRGGL